MAQTTHLASFGPFFFDMAGLEPFSGAPGHTGIFVGRCVCWWWKREGWREVVVVVVMVHVVIVLIRLSVNNC